jgi:DeoR/GlpR family transcriptional regulator of sugar metabolism
MVRSYLQMAIIPQERRDDIINRILGRGHAAIKALAADLQVSEATVRRDLRALADAGEVELVYGGATLPRASDHSITSRAMRNVEAKRAIGKLAADLVADHEMLYIDAGTTCFEMRRYLQRKRGLSVILNSTRLAVELGASTDASIIQLGGHYRADTMDAVGPLAVAAISQLRGYLAFIGADGLGMEFGLSAIDIQTADLYQHVLANAREAVLLVDHTKFASPSLFRICGWEAITRVITDRQPDPGWLTFLTEKGIEVTCPEG